MIYTFKFESDFLAEEKELSHCLEVEIDLKVQVSVERSIGGYSAGNLESWEVERAVIETGQDITSRFFSEPRLVKELRQAIERNHDRIIQKAV
jgi:hypothetical protein